jgi:hypothetical protein
MVFPAKPPECMIVLGDLRHSISGRLMLHHGGSGSPNDGRIGRLPTFVEALVNGKVAP